jgi:hypothetical protein
MKHAFQPISLNRETLPIEVPSGYVGPLTFPGNGKTVWWTGRVAIGLRHERALAREPISQSGLWIQNLLIDGGRPSYAPA